jgi:hypothetical protein
MNTQEIISQFDKLLTAFNNVILFNPFAESWSLEHHLDDKQDKDAGTIHRSATVYINIVNIGDNEYRVDYDNLKDQKAYTFEEVVAIAAEWIQNITFAEWQELVEEREADRVFHQEYMDAYAAIQYEEKSCRAAHILTDYEREYEGHDHFTIEEAQDLAEQLYYVWKSAKQ